MSGTSKGVRRSSRAINQKDVEPLPPWHPARDRLAVSEIHLYMSRMFNLSIRPEEIKAWCSSGVMPKDGGDPIFLKTHSFAGKPMVWKVDLLAFCELI